MTSASAFDRGLARRASGFLLELYAMSRALPLDRFQHATLSRLRAELPFRSAYWGMLRVRPGAPLILHNTFVDALPGEFVDDWETVKHKDELAAKVVTTPGVASSMRTVDMRDHAFLDMGERFEIASATSIAVAAPVPNLLTFLSLYRPAGMPAFDRADRCFQEIIMPHVAAAWHANRLQHVESLRASGNGPRDGFAVTDRHGVLHVNDTAFSDLIRSEWPRWSGSELPVPLRETIRLGRKYDGHRLRIEARRHHDLTVLQVRPRNALDSLSPREAEIVAWYREGLSYKQIAARLNCSPYTVRHHLRAIYGKLGVGNKVALARLS